MATTVETLVTTVEKGNSSESAATAVISESGCAPSMVRKMELKNYEFVVENYSVRKGIGVGLGIRSDEFVVGGQRWVVNLYPQGKNEDAHNAGYVSVFIYRTSENVEPVEILHDIYFNDQSGKLDHFGHSTFASKEVGFISSSSGIGYNRFLSRAALDSPHSPYLKHDSLKLSVCIGVFYYHRVRNHPSPSLSTVLDFKQLLQMQWIDEFVFFRVDDETYCVAKSILVARCPTLLDKHQFQDDLAIPDMDPNIFTVALYFVFLDCLRKIDHEAIDDSDPLNHESFAAKLLAAANWFELKGLKRICESSLSKKVSRASVLSLLHLAHLCNATELKSACLKFAARNRSVIIESDECEILKETCPLLFLDLAGLGDNFSISSKNKGVALYFVCQDSLRQMDHEAIDDSDPLNHESFAAKLLAAADRFEIKGLKRICESTLSNKVSRDSVVSLLQLAHLCNAAELKSACLKFAARNRSVIMVSDECEVLKETWPLLFLELAGFGDNLSIPGKNKGVRVCNQLKNIGLGVHLIKNAR